MKIWCAFVAASVKTRMGRYVIVASAVPLLASCAGAGTSEISPVSVPRAALRSSTEQQPISARCKQFMADFDELVACERANGTLESFDRRIEWRARYFVRYGSMPCNEDPTEQVAYVYHMVRNDLNRDRELRNGQRTAIRNAMFDARVRCKSRRAAG